MRMFGFCLGQAICAEDPAYVILQEVLNKPNFMKKKHIFIRMGKELSLIFSN